MPAYDVFHVQSVPFGEASLPTFCRSASSAGRSPHCFPGFLPGSLSCAGDFLVGSGFGVSLDSEGFDSFIVWVTVAGELASVDSVAVPSSLHALSVPAKVQERAMDSATFWYLMPLRLRP